MKFVFGRRPEKKREAIFEFSMGNDVRQADGPSYYNSNPSPGSTSTVTEADGFIDGFNKKWIGDGD